MASVPLSTAPDGLLRARMEGEPVAALQQALGALGLYTREATGRFDSYTQDAVLQWQQRAGEPRTGSVTSDQLQAMIGAAGIALSGLGLVKGGAFVGGGRETVHGGAFVGGGKANAKAGSHAHDHKTETGTLALGDKGPAVTRLQQALLDLNLRQLPPTGHFDELTRDAVLTWQQRRGLAPTGQVTPEEFARLVDEANKTVAAKLAAAARARQAGTRLVDVRRRQQATAAAFDEKHFDQLYRQAVGHDPSPDRLQAWKAYIFSRQQKNSAPSDAELIAAIRATAADATLTAAAAKVAAAAKASVHAGGVQPLPATPAATITHAPATAPAKPQRTLKLLPGGAATTPTATSTPAPTVTASAASSTSPAPAPEPQPAPSPSPSDYQNSPSAYEGGGGSGSGGGGGSDGAPDTSGSYADTAAPGADGSAPAPTQPDVTVPAVPEPTPSSGLPWGYIAAAAVILLLLADHEKKKKPALSGPPLEELDEDEAVPEAWTAARRRSRRRGRRG